MDSFKDERPKAVVLLSGGLDSTTALAIAQDQGFDVTCLSFRYGQRHLVELSKATELAADGGVRKAWLHGRGLEVEPMGWVEPLPHIVVEFDLRVFGSRSPLVSDSAVPKDRTPEGMGDSIADTYVPARNSVFLSFAAALAETIGADRIFIGVNALDYSGYPDCRAGFVDAMEKALNLGTSFGDGPTALSIETPLITMTKAQIIARGLELGVDYGATHSCYDPREGDGQACGRCDSCVLRAKGFEEVGIPDPAAFDGAELRRAVAESDAALVDGNR